MEGRSVLYPKTRKLAKTPEDQEACNDWRRRLRRTNRPSRSGVPLRWPATDDEALGTLSTSAPFVVLLWRETGIEEPPKKRRRSFSRARARTGSDQRPLLPGRHRLRIFAGLHVPALLQGTRNDAENEAVARREPQSSVRALSVGR